MKTYNLDIKDIENKFVITIDKKQLDADYILSLLNWLQFATYEPNELNNYFKKYQQIPKIEPIITKEKKRIWNYSGSVNLNNQLDNINLRDFAYE